MGIFETMRGTDPLLDRLIQQPEPFQSTPPGSKIRGAAWLSVRNGRNSLNIEYQVCSAVFFVFLVASQGGFLGVGAQTLFTRVDLGLLCHPVRDKLLPELLPAVFVPVAQVPEVLDAEFEDFPAVWTEILVLRELLGVFLRVITWFEPSPLYNNDCSMHVFSGVGRCRMGNGAPGVGGFGH